MRKSVLGLLLVATACVGGPVKMRPGSNVALPEKPSIAEAVARTLVCTKREGEKNPPPVSSSAGDPCSANPDSLAPKSKKPEPVPEAPKRP
jgi:hypothetical protein